MNGQHERPAFSEQISIPETLPVLALRDIVIFPYVIAPLSVSREKSIHAIDSALAGNRMMLFVAQRQQDIDDPRKDDLYGVGTVAVIMRMLKLPDGKIRILVQGVSRARVVSLSCDKGYFEAAIEPIQERSLEAKSLEQEALLRNVKAALEKSVALGKTISPEVMVIAANLEDAGRLADLAASNLDFKVEEAQEVLEIPEAVSRLRKVHSLLNRELELLSMQQQINTQAKGEMDKSQREYFLRQQLKAIQLELGEGNEFLEEIRQFREKVEKGKFPKHVREEVEKQLGKLERMHPDVAETATLRNYLDTLLTLPWNKFTRDNLDIEKARRILNEDHYGLEQVKERILEYLAVRKLKKRSKGPILCFVGPPGVGKTSLGKSIARAMGRKFTRTSLGGVRDEAEIRGHRRTYVGAMPGRVVQGIMQAGTSNPVFMLDEVDKIGADFRGDPSSALLEVLDPEQNSAFRDHYIGVTLDLSHVMFITTANLLDPIHPAFRDRMEVIRLPGYTEEEKLEIAKLHLLPKQVAEHGLDKKNVQFSDGSLKGIIHMYTREAGLRNLEREIAAVCRKIAMRVAASKNGHQGRILITEKNLSKYLGPARILPDELLSKDQIGVATGVAWTPMGGDLLFIESSIVRGKGHLILTGQLGDVMKESAQAALTYLKARAREFSIHEDLFETKDIHVHVPEGAIPKDGPSAGITIAASMLSVFSDRPVRKNIAMTGEITLRGNVLPVGGIKEKLLAARRAKCTKLILPALNKKDVDEISPKLLKGIDIVYVEEVKEIFKLALR
jgi:ATP-dependent Lon protease